VDAEMAQAAGMPFLLFTRGYRRGPVERLLHAAAFDRFAELPGLVLGGIRERGRESAGPV
jgi:phosphoglycolate phosphatase